MRIAGAILAGGKASRYAERPKGLLRLPSGETIIERLLEELKKAGVGPCVICANDEGPYAEYGVRVIPDQTPGRGPLAGIQAALYHFKDVADAVLFLPCDTPNITAEEITQLCEQFQHRSDPVVVAETKAVRWHPLCGVVDIGMLDDVTRAVQKAYLGVTRLWRELGATSTRFEDADRFANVNSPSDLATALRAAGPQHTSPNERKRGETSDTEEGGDAMPRVIGVPDTLRSKLTDFLDRERIPLTVVSGSECEVNVRAIEEKRECTVSELYPGGWIKCEVARAMAKRLHIGYRSIGKIINLLDIKIRACSLGCFE